jgi:HipA-like C-terminal domain
MNAPFPILEVTSAMRSDVEQLGSKPKFWFKHNGENWLFKEARINTGEDWSEKVASEIALLLGLPTHETALAAFEGKRGCAVKSFLGTDESVLVHGNELLAGLITGYAKEKVFRQADHTFDNIVRVVLKLFRSDAERRAAANQIAGYVVLDALIGNTDRHHQNWGVVVDRRIVPDAEPVFVTQIAPTFDHASSLGRELSDDMRERHLRENTVDRYILRGRGGIFESASSKNGLSPIALATLLAFRYPGLFAHWRRQVESLPAPQWDELLARVPNDRISVSGRRFASAQIAESRKMLLETIYST